MRKKQNDTICSEIYFDGINDLYYKESFHNVFISNRTAKRGVTLILTMTEAKAKYILQTCKNRKNELITFSEEDIRNAPLTLEVCIIHPTSGQKLSSYSKASIRYIEDTLVLSLHFNKEDFIPTYKEYKLKSKILIRNVDKNRIGITFLMKGQKATPPAKILRKVPVKKTVTGENGTSSPKTVTARWKGTKSTASLSYRPENHDGSKFSLDRYFG